MQRGSEERGEEGEGECAEGFRGDESGVGRNPAKERRDNSHGGMARVQRGVPGFLPENAGEGFPNGGLFPREGKDAPGSSLGNRSLGIVVTAAASKTLSS